MSIEAAVDGSCLGNPGPTGWAWYVDDRHWAAGGFPTGTNNLGELTAVARLLEATAHLDDDLVVYCDSQYVVNSLTTWMPEWKRRGWRTSGRKPVKNADLMRELDGLLQGRNVRFVWVKGHDGHALNERVDDLARAQAGAFQGGAPADRGPGWAGRELPARADASAAPDAGLLF